MVTERELRGIAREALRELKLNDWSIFHAWLKPSMVKAPPVLCFDYKDSEGNLQHIRFNQEPEADDEWIKEQIKSRLLKIIKPYK